MLINLAIDFLQDFHKCSISRDFSILKKPKLYKGSLARALATLTKRARESDAAVEKQVDKLENMFGKLHVSDKLSMMDKLGHIVDESVEQEQYDVDDDVSESETEEKQSRSSGISETLNIVHGSGSQMNRKPPEIKLPGEVGKQTAAKLIEEVGTEGGRSQVEPTHTVSTLEKDNQSFVCLKIELPGVKSVAQCELDISQVGFMFNK